MSKGVYYNTNEIEVSAVQAKELEKRNLVADYRII